MLLQVRRAKRHLGFVEQLCAEGGWGSSVPGGFNAILKTAATLDWMGRTPRTLEAQAGSPRGCRGGEHRCGDSPDVFSSCSTAFSYS